jgi:hypothetical protein
MMAAVAAAGDEWERPCTHRIRYADFDGALDTSNFSSLQSALSSRWQLDTVDAQGVVTSSPGPAQLAVVSNTSALAQIRLTGVVDDASSPRVSETWDIALSAGSRAFTLNTTGASVGAKAAAAAAAARDDGDDAAAAATAAGSFVARHSVGFSALSIYGLFDAGVVQMMNAAPAASFFVGTRPLPTVYGE